MYFRFSLIIHRFIFIFYLKHFVIMVKVSEMMFMTICIIATTRTPGDISFFIGTRKKFVRVCNILHKSFLILFSLIRVLHFQNYCSVSNLSYRGLLSSQPFLYSSPHRATCLLITREKRNTGTLFQVSVFFHIFRIQSSYFLLICSKIG